jgi:hypothetical protein
MSRALVTKSAIRHVRAFAVALAIACLFVHAQAPPSKILGTVKAVNGNTVTVTTDSGSEAVVRFSVSARILQAAQGVTDLKSAPAISVSDIAIGDRLLARGQAPDANSFVASSALVMKKSEIASRQQQEQEEWRRGVGGIVKAVDIGSGTVTVANSLASGGNTVSIHASPNTKILRYAPDSVKFDEARPGTLEQIKPGDQLRARGAKSMDGAEFNAQAIVSGTFRDIAGTVTATDRASNTLTVMDLTSKKSVTIKITNDSQLRKLPQQMAMGIAMRLKGDSARPPRGSPSNAAPNHAQGETAHENGTGAATGTARSAGGNWHANGNGHPDFQQILNRMPAFSLADLNKGDAVMLVATEGSTSSNPTAITVLAGVEPILTASPTGASASTILSPWNLSASGGPAGDTSEP